MGTFLQAITDGVLQGGVYALMAVGLDADLRRAGHHQRRAGALVVLGAYMSYVLSVAPGIDLFVGLIITVPAFFVLGMVIECGVHAADCTTRDRTAMSILATYAVAIIIEGTLSVVCGADVLSAQRLLRRHHLPRAEALLRSSTCSASSGGGPAGRVYLCYTGPLGPGRSGAPCRTAGRPELIGVERRTAWPHHLGRHRRGGHRAGGMAFGATSGLNPIAAMT